MQHIDEKFKERKPGQTVALIQEILEKYGINVVEKWNDSGIENCASLGLSANGGTPVSNGKGVTEALARASAYGEFVERLQGGMFFSKFQSIERDPVMNVHTFAPDARYMTVQELEETGEWMDPIIETYNDPRITRKSIARLCAIYDVTPGDKVLTLPFYSLFEKKHVYIPISFVDQIYGTNGCCAGNSRNEAWVHALSEIMERHAALEILLSGKAAPKIPDEVLCQYKTVWKILTTVRENGNFDIDIFDYSGDYGYPVVSTRIINKENHCYRVNAAADPVLEIAIQRTLTEIFQGMNLRDFYAQHGGKVLVQGPGQDATNIINQLETGSGMFAADFFANELTCQREAASFPDNSGKSNEELLDYALDTFRKLGKPVYVRNFSYLGFPSYRFVVPGFSEALPVYLSETFPQYVMADQAARIMKNPAAASDAEMTILLTYNQSLSGIYSRYYNFGIMSGLPIWGLASMVLACGTRAYAAWRLKRYQDVIRYINPLLTSDDADVRDYFSLLTRYIQYRNGGMAEEKARCILGKFYRAEIVAALFDALDAGKTPFDALLMQCDCKSCDSCKYQKHCSYQANRAMNQKVGAVYSTFTHGQDPEGFAI